MAQLELITRFRTGCTQPTESELTSAIREIFVEDNPALNESDYREHPNAWLSYGHQSGERWCVYTLEVHRDRSALLYKLADQDDSVPEFELTMAGLDEAHALRLWRLLADMNVASLLAEPWQPKASDA